MTVISGSRKDAAYRKDSRFSEDGNELRRAGGDRVAAEWPGGRDDDDDDDGIRVN